VKVLWLGWAQLLLLVHMHLGVLAACMIVGLVMAADLLAERQRRATLLALVRAAPAGSVVVQERGRGGPAMGIWVGSSDTRKDEGSV
jgi:hypothetical protein